jgi:hypothetical protein
MDAIAELAVHDWNASARGAAAKLGAGALLIAPDLHFDLTLGERRFLSPDCVDGKAKQVSYRPLTRALQGTALAPWDRQELPAMMTGTIGMQRVAVFPAAGVQRPAHYRIHHLQTGGNCGAPNLLA